VAADAAFEIAAPITELHTISVADNVGGVVSTAEMSKVFVYRMAQIGAPGREIYDQLRSAARNDRCPLCGQRLVATLDHHLPKSEYPALAVAPVNLIPSCSDCNRAKLHNLPRTAVEETLHPYFDDVENDWWLRGRVVEVVPAAVEFYVQAPVGWSNLLGDRVQNHFKIFKLGELYASHAAEEILNIREYLRRLFDHGGAEEVRAHLQLQAASSEAARVNSWQTASYKAFADSDWFCAGGFIPTG
jgi:hypothetical protein